MKFTIGFILPPLARLAFSGLILILLLLCLKCNSVEPPPPPPPNGTTVYNTINLTIEWTDLYRIKLQWNISVKDTLNNYRYELKRKDELGIETTINFFITGVDTNYIDGEIDSLASGKNFIYKVSAYDSDDKLIDTSRTIIGRTLSPTSHNITWQIDTLGQPGNFLYDVWGLDESNVYAVGFVELQSGNSSIIKWDGIEWKPFTNVGGVKYGIYGFSEASIFVVGESSNRGIVAIWNGAQWTEYRSDYFLARGDTVYPLRSVWGSSTNDVWAVGDQGTIIHWDGNEWRRVQSPTNLLLYDVWGTTEDNVYAIRFSLSQNSQLIKYNGNNWIEITNQLPSGQRNFASLWFDEGETGYLVGNNVLFYDGGTFNRIDINQDRFLLRVRGRNSTDVFTVGQMGRVHHFNGLDWITYPELFDETPGMELRGVYVTETTVFTVGIINNGSIIYRGVRQ